MPWYQGLLKGMQRHAGFRVLFALMEEFSRFWPSLHVLAVEAMAAIVPARNDDFRFGASFRHQIETQRKSIPKQDRDLKRPKLCVTAGV